MISATGEAVKSLWMKMQIIVKKVKGLVFLLPKADPKVLSADVAENFLKFFRQLLKTLRTSRNINKAQ